MAHPVSFQVLALENNVMELQMFLDKAQTDLAAAKEELSIMETEHKELANEYIALKTSHVQLTADYTKEVHTGTSRNDYFGLKSLNFSSSSLVIHTCQSSPSLI